MQTLTPRLLKVGQAAQYLATSDKTIRRLVLTGELPFLQRFRGTHSPFLFDIKDLDIWVEAHKILPLTT